MRSGRCGSCPIACVQTLLALLPFPSSLVPVLVGCLATAGSSSQVEGLLRLLAASVAACAAAPSSSLPATTAVELLLALEGHCDGEAPVRPQLLRLLSLLVDRAVAADAGEERGEEAAFLLFRLLHRLDCGVLDASCLPSAPSAPPSLHPSDAGEEVAAVSEALRRLSAGLCGESPVHRHPAPLYLRFFPRLLPSTEESPSSISRATALSALLLLRRCPSCALALFPRLLPLLRSQLSDSAGDEGRAAVVAAVAELLLAEGEAVTEEQTDSVLRALLLPACTWRAGQANCVLRLHSLTCALALVQRQLRRPPAPLTSPVAEWRAALLPVVRSHLDDDRLDSRLVAARLLSAALLLPSSAPWSPELYSGLLSDTLHRLDDSDDGVRCLALAAATRLLDDPDSPDWAEVDPTTASARQWSRVLALHAGASPASSALFRAIEGALRALARRAPDAVARAAAEEGEAADEGGGEEHRNHGVRLSPATGRVALLSRAVQAAASTQPREGADRDGREGEDGEEQAQRPLRQPRTTAAAATLCV